MTEAVIQHGSSQTECCRLLNGSVYSGSHRMSGRATVCGLTLPGPVYCEGEDVWIYHRSRPRYSPFMNTAGTKNGRLQVLRVAEKLTLHQLLMNLQLRLLMSHSLRSSRIPEEAAERHPSHPYDPPVVSVVPRPLCSSSAITDMCLNSVGWWLNISTSRYVSCRCVP